MQNTQSESFDVKFVDNLPQQPYSSIECGVFIAAYTEFLSNGVDIRAFDFDVNMHQHRYGALLWEYAYQKIEGEAISDNEQQTKTNRPYHEDTSHLDIVID
ncbi:hypothetical protein HAX54_040457 [Datura stramonium]|uniref:Ubiquitin-like protease family profile domain-containing protein n=1 Tax=Datura stramonium TaxID=4076 RepID=A0ABS8SKH7_DATST|nr:hypothetical protein [Datura stramonium]